MSSVRTITGGAVLSIAGATDTGKCRDYNEDSLLLNETIGLAVVADGVGGQNAGKTASSIVVDIVASAVRRRLLAVVGVHFNAVELEAEELNVIVRSALIDAHAAVLEAALGDTRLTGMASTVVLVLVQGGLSVIGWIGDSQAYLLRGGRLLPSLTRSHNLEHVLGVSIQPSSGTESKSPLTRVVGGSATLFGADVCIRPVQAGDLFLLCSDGLTDMVSETEFGGILADGHLDLNAMARQLIQAANRAGGEDNITVALVRVVRAPEASDPGKTGASQRELELSCRPTSTPRGWTSPKWVLAGTASAGMIIGATGFWIAAGGDALAPTGWASLQSPETLTGFSEDDGKLSGGQTVLILPWEAQSPSAEPKRAQPKERPTFSYTEIARTKAGAESPIMNPSNREEPGSINQTVVVSQPDPGIAVQPGALVNSPMNSGITTSGGQSDDLIEADLKPRDNANN